MVICYFSALEIGRLPRDALPFQTCDCNLKVCLVQTYATKETAMDDSSEQSSNHSATSDENSDLPEFSNASDDSSSTQIRLNTGVKLMTTSFGKNLETQMKKKNYTVSSLAKAINESSKSVREWIGVGARMPRSPDVLKKLCNVLDVSVHELLFGEPDPQSLLTQLIEKTEIHTGLYEISIKKVSPK